MNPQIIQNLRYKLQKRVRRLNSVDVEMFIPALRQFWVFFESNPTYTGVVELLSAQFPEMSRTIERISEGGEALVGSTEEESAAIGIGVLRYISQLEHHDHFRGLVYPFINKWLSSNEALEFIRDIFLEPFYEYVDEKLDEQGAILSLLFRYKHRSEWFHRDRLFELTELESRKAEALLALDLYSYLYDQGIDFSIEPSSLTGKIDLIAAQGSDDPLLADAKIFDAASRSKTYICKAFNQIYTYTQQYNEPFGYLIIFKVTDKDLSFSLSMSSRNLPVVIYNHKAIFLITIDIYPNPKPVSQREPLKVVSITEEDLFRTVEE